MFHGTAPDFIALALQKAIPQLSYDSRHQIFALFGIAGIYYVYRLASKFVDEWTGVFAALFLAITLMWFGYMFINHKDIPFATLLLTATYYSLLALTGHPTSRRFWLKTGLAIGLLAATKFVGLLLLLFVVVVYFACLLAFPGPRETALHGGNDRRDVPPVPLSVLPLQFLGWRHRRGRWSLRARHLALRATRSAEPTCGEGPSWPNRAGLFVRIEVRLSVPSKLQLATKAKADYFVAQRRGKKSIPSEFAGLPVVAEVRREGVLLARVYAARP